MDDSKELNADQPASKSGAGADSSDEETVQPSLRLSPSISKDQTSNPRPAPRDSKKGTSSDQPGLIHAPVAGPETKPRPEGVGQTRGGGMVDPFDCLSPWFEITDYSITKVLILINSFLFGAMVLTSGIGALFEPSGSTLHLWGANYGVDTLGEQPWRLITSTFIHGGIVHLAMNMVVLWDIGRFVERLAGRTKFILIYLLSGIGGSLLSVLATPAVPAVGASGAVLGVYGALLGFFLNHRAEVPAKLVAICSRTIFALLFCVLIFGTFVPGIDNAAHLGGLITGFMCGALLIRSHPIPIYGLLIETLGVLALLGLFWEIYGLARLAPFDADGEYRLELAERLVKQNRPTDAIQYLTEFIANHPDQAIGWGNRGRINLLTHNWQGAYMDLSKAIELDPKNATYYQRRGIASFELSDSMGSISDFTTAIRLDRANAASYAYRADVFLQLGNYRNALDDLNVFLRKDPRNARALRTRAIIHMIVGQFEGADQDFNAAIKADPENTELWNGYAVFAYAVDEFDNAIKATQKAIRLDEWKTARSTYAAITATLCYQMQNDTAPLSAITSEGLNKSQHLWPYPVLGFVAGDLSEDTLFKIQMTSEQLTESRAYAGAYFANKKEFGKAASYFNWVVQFGNKNLPEYAMAKTKLSKLRRYLQ